MTENEEIYYADKVVAIEYLLKFATACPHMVKQGISLEEFTDDLIKAAEEFAKHISPGKR